MVSIVSAVRDLGRLREIYVVLVRHGFGELAQRLGIGPRRSDPPPPGLDSASDGSEEKARALPEESRKISLAERVRLVLMDLGPSFVKLGQIASTRPDILPAEWIVELKKLQDEVSPLPFTDIRLAVEASLGTSLSEVFDYFDETPLAAASIGQVHKATLKHPDGPQQVVVKIQRPGIRSTVARDLELLHGLAALIERTIPESKIYSPSALVDQFDQAITCELDFSMEAEHAIRFARNFEGHAQARFPRIYKEASSKQILTLEFLAGSKIYEAIRVHGHHGPAIAKASVGILIKMIFEDGFFHADPHPGNILLSGTPEHPILGFVDLGMVGRLSPEMRDKTVDMMVAAIRQDNVALADALYALGTPTRKVDMRAYRAEVAVLSEKYLGRPLKEIDLSQMIGDLVGGATKFGVEIPSDFLLVGKALMTIEGVGKEIDPDLDVFNEAKPYFFELLQRRYSPERIGMGVWRGMERLSSTAYDLPQQAREVLDDLRLGRLLIKSTDPELPVIVDRLGRRIFSGLAVSSFLLTGTLLLNAGRHEWLGIVLFLLAGLVLFSHLGLDFIRRWR